MSTVAETVSGTGRESDGPLAAGNFIGGQWQPAVTGATFESRDPADARDVVGTFAASGPADVAAAVRAAELAFPAWRATPPPKRGEIMYRFAALLAEHRERLARHMTREMGKVLAEARGDVQEGIDIAFLLAGEGRRPFGDTVPSELPDQWGTPRPAVASPSPQRGGSSASPWSSAARTASS